jgi:hypothetical protein
MRDLKPEEKDKIDFYAKIANASYVAPNQRASYTVVYGLKDKGLIYDADASDKFHTVYIDPKNNKVYMSIRGTSLKTGYGDAITDLLTDASVAFGRVNGTKRFKRSERKLMELKEKYPDMEVESFGHSLGGTIGSNLSKKHGIQSHNFSTGSGIIDPNSVFEAANPNFHPEYKDKTHYYHVGDFDVLSQTSMGRAGVHHIYDKKEDLGSHSLQNYFLASEMI